MTTNEPTREGKNGPLRITKRDALAAVRALAEQRPSARNPFTSEAGECVYTSATGEHCIVGQALVDLGCKVPAYRTRANTRSARSLMLKGGPIQFDFGASFTPAAVQVFDDVQTAADAGGTTWGEAVERACNGRSTER